MSVRDLIEELKSKKTCAYCDKKACQMQDGKPVCKGHAKGGDGC